MDRSLLASCLLTATMCGAAPAAAQVAGSLVLAPCRLEHPRGLSSVAARCGRFSVAENPDEPDGRHIELAVAVVPAISTRAEPDPLFLLAGGPGQGAREGFVGLLGALDGVRRNRDLVMVDQRGTGDSHPMNCDFPEESWAEADVTAEDFRRLARQCLDELPGDPRFYTTSIAVRDLDAVRAALGYDRINLYGGSYGTRVAQHYARRYPERVRAMVLDSVVAPELALGASMSIDADAALRAHFARCANDEACAARFPTLEGDFDQLRSDLKRTPVAVRLADPVSAEPRSIEFTAGHFGLAVRMLTYSDTSAALLPLLIDEARARGNFTPLAAQAEMVSDELDQALAYGMHNTVVCAEDLPFLDRAALDTDALRRSYLGDIMLEGLQAMCDVWPRGPVDADFKAPLRSAVPTLLMSGSFDPVTPPAYAALAAAGLSDHASVVFAGQGHLQLQLRCAQSLVRRFLAAGTATGLDTSCVDAVAPAPFFLSFSGGAP